MDRNHFGQENKSFTRSMIMLLVYLFFWGHWANTKSSDRSPIVRLLDCFYVCVRTGLCSKTNVILMYIINMSLKWNYTGQPQCNQPSLVFIPPLFHPLFLHCQNFISKLVILQKKLFQTYWGVKSVQISASWLALVVKA